MAGRDSTSTAGRGATERPLWTIGAVSRETGLSPHTIRVWQRRYGFPKPNREPSGHRLYSDSDVRRLRRIVDAIRLGHRPGQVVALPEARLARLVGGASGPNQSGQAGPDRLGDLFELIRNQRVDELTSALLQDASVLGPLNFVDRRAIPLIERVGQAWSAGTIEIRHEHAFSERLGDVLRALRLPYERGADGPLVLLATLSGERHALGLQMAALVVALAGGRPDVLGTDTPAAEVASSWKARRTDAVAISVSPSSAGAKARRELARLRAAIPAATPIFVGGRGAAASDPGAGIEILPELGALYDWVRRAGGRGPGASRRIAWRTR